MAGLLGNGPSRHVKVFREEFPAVIRFNGVLYMEEFDIDSNQHMFIEISEEVAEGLLRARK